MNKCPVTVLQANLKAVYFLNSMKYFVVGFGDTNSTDPLYLTNNGAVTGYSDTYLEQTFPHEFSSILFRNFPSSLDAVTWKNTNIPDFDYNDPEGPVWVPSAKTNPHRMPTPGFVKKVSSRNMPYRAWITM